MAEQLKPVEPPKKLVTPSILMQKQDSQSSAGSQPKPVPKKLDSPFLKQLAPVQPPSKTTANLPD